MKVFSKKKWLILFIIQMVLAGWALFRLFVPGTMRDSLQYEIEAKYAGSIVARAQTMCDEYKYREDDEMLRDPIAHSGGFYFKHIPIASGVAISFDMSRGGKIIIKPSCIQIEEERYFKNHYFNRFDWTMTPSKQNEMYNLFEQTILKDIPYKTNRSRFIECLNFLRYAMFQLVLILFPLVPITILWVLWRFLKARLQVSKSRKARCSPWRIGDGSFSL